MKSNIFFWKYPASWIAVAMWGIACKFFVYYECSRSGNFPDVKQMTRKILIPTQKFTSPACPLLTKYNANCWSRTAEWKYYSFEDKFHFRALILALASVVMTRRNYLHFSSRLKLVATYGLRVSMLPYSSSKYFFIPQKYYCQNTLASLKGNDFPSYYRES